MATKKETPTKSPKETAPAKAAVVDVAQTGDLTEEEQDLDESGIAEVVETATDKGAITLKQGRRKLVQQMQTHAKDSGSTEVQVALLTGKINDLVKHLKEHIHDNDSRQGLLKMVGRRRRLLRFMKKGSETKYQNLIAELKLRK